MTLLDQLLAATPPPGDLETDAFLVAAAEMMAARERILATATREPAAADDPRVVELRARDTRWSALIAAHQDRVGAVRRAGARVKAYRQK